MDTPSDLSSEPPPSRREVTIRDDQSDFPSLLDSAKACRRNGGRLRIIDSGKLAAFELEWLAEAGADIYTSDLGRKALPEFVLIQNASRKGNAVTAYFHHAPFYFEEKEEAVSFTSLKEMGRSGLYLYLSNKTAPRDFLKLEELAYASAAAGNHLVYYHHGLLDPALEELARQGAWIHVSCQSLQKEDDQVFLCDCVRSARQRGANIVFHVESPVNLSWLKDILAAGTNVFFRMPPSDYRSALRPLEVEAQRRKLDERAYYLYATFLL
jgi:hypothetical protein